MSLVKIAVTFDPAEIRRLYRDRRYLNPYEKERLRKALQWRNKARTVFSKNPGLREKAKDKALKLYVESGRYKTRNLQDETRQRLRHLLDVLDTPGGKGTFGL